MKRMLLYASLLMMATQQVCAADGQQLYINYKISPTGEVGQSSDRAYFLLAPGQKSVHPASSYAAGTDMTCQAIPPDGMKVDDWKTATGATLPTTSAVTSTGQSGESFIWKCTDAAYARILAAFDYIQYKIKYVTSKGSAPAEKTLSYEQSYNLQSVASIPAGYEFKRWDAKSNVSSYTGLFAANAKVSGAKFELNSYRKDDAVITLTAFIAPKTYAVTTDGENCTVSCDATGTYDSSLSLSVTFDASRYDLTSLTIHAGDDATGDVLRQYTAKDATFKMSDLNAYYEKVFVKAVCTRKILKYDITYKPGAGVTGSQVVDQKTEGDSEFKLRGATYQKTGCEQDGWSTSEGGDKVYDLLAYYTADASITLYPHWSAKSYELTIDPNGGSYDGKKIVQTLPERLVVGKTDLNQLAVPVHTNIFYGYYDSSNGGRQVYDVSGRFVVGSYWNADGQFVGSANLKVWAIWGEPLPAHEATFVATPAEAGTVAVDYGDLHTNGTDFALQLIEGSNFVMTASVTNTGYSFSCWTNSLGFTTNDNPWTYAVPSVVTNVALFTGNVYKVTFDGQRWFKDTQTKDVTYGDVYGDPETPVTFEGYKLEGWYTEQEGKGTRYAATDKVVIAEDHRLYANWTELGTYTIHYDRNGATSGSMVDQTLYRETLTALTPNSFLKTGYAFANWTNENGYVFADGAKVLDLAEPSETVTLYAVWSNNVYTVDFDANGGTGTPMLAQTFTYDVPKALPECAYTKVGYEFGGWTNATKNVFFTNCEEIVTLCTGATGDDRITLTALWALPDVGDYSRAMHCTNLKWESTGNQTATATSWETIDDPGAGQEEDSEEPSGSEVRGVVPSSGGQTDYLVTTVTTSGTLSFLYKMDDHGQTSKPTLTLRYRKLVDGQPTGDWIDLDSWKPPTEEWYPGDYEIAMPAGATSCQIGFVLTGSNMQSVSLDQVKWTPTGGGEPTPGEPVAPTAAGVADGRFTLTIPTASGTEYGVWTNANLTVPVDAWGLWKKETATGATMDFSFELLPGVPQLFFRACEVEYK